MKLEVAYGTAEFQSGVQDRGGSAGAGALVSRRDLGSAALPSVMRKVIAHALKEQ